MSAKTKAPGERGPGNSKSTSKFTSSGNNKSAIRVPFKRINETLISHAESWIPEWLPGGKREGADWVCLCPWRVDRHLGAFRVHLEKGFWKDFSTGDGGDLVDLYARLFTGQDMGEAASDLTEMLGLGRL